MFIHESMLTELLERVFDGVYIVDTQRNILFWNRGAEQITGYSAAEVTGRPCSADILNHVDEEGRQLCLGFCPLHQSLIDRRYRHARVFLHHKDGHRLPVHIRIIPLENSAGESVGAMEIFHDDSGRFELQQRLDERQKTAFHDPLTRIPDRIHSESILSSLLEEYRRYGWPFGLLLCAVDDLPALTAILSPETAERVLRMVARTIRTTLPDFDHLGRWSGEVFLALLHRVDEAGLRRTAETVRGLVEQSFLAQEEKALRATVSIAATLVRGDDTTAALTARAAALLETAKQAGGNRVSLG